MKTCTICKLEQPLAEFNKHSKRKDGLQSACRTCNRERSRAYYKRNPSKHIQNVAVNNAKYREMIRKKLCEYFKAHPCVDCGTDDIRVLEFDHVRGEKEQNVSKLLRSATTWEKVQTEIMKCDVRCANCHRIVSYERAGCWRLQGVYL